MNARLAMKRACELAQEYGVGLVALGNNNHWMRGGSYGWQAADAGMIGICWSNTMPNMPAWGGKNRKIGNNPFIMAIPRSNGNHAVIDCAVSQFSYGKIEEARLKGQQLPVPGGYDSSGNLTTDPGEIEKTWRVLPMGYWKGSGISIALDLKGQQLPVPGGYDSSGNLTTDPGEIEKTWRVLPMGYWKGSGISIALDLIATVLTNANSVSKIGTFDDEVGLSQVMIAIDPGRFQDTGVTDRIVDEILADIKSSEPIKEGGEVFYPGEIELNTREENRKNGIPVVDQVWDTICSLEK